MTYVRPDEQARLSYDMIKSGQFEKALQQAAMAGPAPRPSSSPSSPSSSTTEKLPDFSVFAKYLSLGGSYSVMDDDGFTMTGFTLEAPESVSRRSLRREPIRLGPPERTRRRPLTRARAFQPRRRARGHGIQPPDLDVSSDCRTSWSPADAHRLPACDPAARRPDPQPQGDRPRPASRSADRGDRASAARARARWPSTRSTRRASGVTSRRSRPTHGSSSRSWTSPTPTGSTASRRPSRSAQSHGRHSGRSTVGTITEIHDALGAALCPRRPGDLPELRPARRSPPRPPPSRGRSRPARRHALRDRLSARLRAGDRPGGPGHALARRGLHPRSPWTARPCGWMIPASILPDAGSVDVIVDRLVRGKDPPERRTRLDRNGVRQGAGPLPDPRRRRVLDLRPRLAMQPMRDRSPRAPAQPVPVQQPPRGLPGLRGLRPDDGARPGPDRPRPVEDDPRGRHRPLDDARPIGAPRGVARRRGRRSTSRSTSRSSASTPSRSSGCVEGVPGTGFTGLDGFFQALERKSYKLHVRVFLSRWRRYQTCPACHGARLRPEALAVRIEGRNIAELSAMTIRGAASVPGRTGRALRDQPAAAGLLGQVENRLGYLAEIGLDYLTLDRPARRLSGGELQRVVLTKTLGSGLVNTLYVLDEPTVGLHPQRRRPADRGPAAASATAGNTLVVVEHDDDVIRASDHVVDLGPGPARPAARSSTAGRSRASPSAEGSRPRLPEPVASGRAIPASRRPVTGRVARADRGARATTSSRST